MESSGTFQHPKRPWSQRGGMGVGTHGTLCTSVEIWGSSTCPSIPMPGETNVSEGLQNDAGDGPSGPSSSRPPHPLPEPAGRNADEGERWLQPHLPHGERKCQTFLQCHPSSADRPRLPPPQASSRSPHPEGPGSRTGQLGGLPPGQCSPITQGWSGVKKGHRPRPRP